MKNSKKFLIFLLTVLMLVTAFLVASLAVSGIPELLNTDNAYVYDYALKQDLETTSGKSIRTGTAPFDENDEAGNDSEAINDVVRTFDVVSYTAEFYTSLQPGVIEEGISGYKNGSIYFEYILPVSKSQAVFDTAGMAWLSTMPEIEYEIAEVMINGMPSQVLRGSYLMTPAKGNPSAVGQSYNNITLAIRILNMKNGDTLRPIFTTWLRHNDVGVSYHGNNAGIPNSIVYGSNHKCAVHNKKEYASFISAPVKVSCAPSYNVEVVKTSHPNNTLVSDFDFSTGNETAAYKELGMVSGRMYGYGLALQIAGSKTKGMMGIELPDGSDINFDLNLSTSYIKTGGGVIEDLALDDGYKAVLWSGDPNENNEKASNGRTIKTYINYIVGGIPFNKDTNNVYNLVSENDYYRCKNGGSWTFTADENDPSRIHVSVSGYEVDLSCLPYNVTTSGKESYNAKWYNPNDIGLTEDGKVDQFWRVQTAVISAGKMWVVQPYYNDVPLTGSFEDKGSTDFNKIHIKDYYGAGTINTTLEDYDLDMVSITGKTTLDIGQAIDTDDKKVYDYAFERPGTENTTIRYTRTKEKNHEYPLTDDCGYNNADWAVSGQKIGIRVTTVSNDAEGLSSAVAMSSVIKFDDVFFDPISTSVTNQKSSAVYTPNRTVLWGAKADKTGWDHKGLKADQIGYDYEMLTTTADDLLWFESLDELKAQGYVPVAVLEEQNGFTKIVSGGNNQMDMWVYGNIKFDCPIEYPYLTACEGYIWSRNDVVDEITIATGKTIHDVTDEDYANYVKSDKFFTRANGDKICEDTIHSPHFKKNGKTSSAFVNSIKAQYENGVYVKGSGAPYYIDSCYVIPFKTKVNKKVAQIDNSGSVKKAYDMGANQRVVDYVINPTIERGEAGGFSDLDNMTTTVTVVDTLPKGLTYIIGSAYYSPDGSAEYTQGESCMTQGTIKDAESFAPTSVTVNSDGTTTIEWTIRNVKIDPQQVTTDIGLIYFSADIGTPMNEATDVVNQQELKNQVIVYSDFDKNTLYAPDSNGNVVEAFSVAKGNLSIASIRVLKQQGFSICKVADCDAIDKGESIDYTLYIGNNSSNSVKNAIIVDNLPYNGDENGSSFHGERYISKFNVQSMSNVDLKAYRYFYTTNTAYRGLKSLYYTENGYTVDSFAQSDDWTELHVAPNGTNDKLFKDFPSMSKQQGDNQIVSIVIIGDIDGGNVLSMRCELVAPDTDTNDRLVNTMSCNKLVSYASTIVISRSITGIVWGDLDNDGVKDEDEEFVEDTTITLLIKDKTGEYKPYIITDIEGNKYPATIKPGQAINLVSGEITEAEEGNYSFDGLASGDFAVVYSGDYTIIDIVMPPATDLKGSEKHEVIKNVGLTTVAVTMNKEWSDDDDLDKLRGDYGVTLYANGEPASEEVILDKDTLTYTWSGVPFSKDGQPIEYTVVETTIPEGYTPIYDGFNILNEHKPVKQYLPVVFFAPDNIGFYLADGITYYRTSTGDGKTVTNHTIFNDSTTIYVERGEYISFKPYTMFTSYVGDYLASLKSGENEALALPSTVEADENGYFNFRVVDDYYLVTLVQYAEDVTTGEKQPWYQFLINMLLKIADFFRNLFN